MVKKLAPVCLVFFYKERQPIFNEFVKAFDLPIGLMMVGTRDDVLDNEKYTLEVFNV